MRHRLLLLGVTTASTALIGQRTPWFPAFPMAKRPNVNEFGLARSRNGRHDKTGVAGQGRPA
jgi:hypothetical protein